MKTYKINNYKSYSATVWLSSVFIPPAVILIYLFLSKKIDANIFPDLILFYFILCLLSVFFTLIPFLFFEEINNRIFPKFSNQITLKITINLQALFWFLTPNFLFIFYLGSFDKELISLFLMYSFVISVAVWFLKIEKDLSLIKKEFREDVLDDDFNLKK